MKFNRVVREAASRTNASSGLVPLGHPAATAEEWKPLATTASTFGNNLKFSPAKVSSAFLCQGGRFQFTGGSLVIPCRPSHRGKFQKRDHPVLGITLRQGCIKTRAAPSTAGLKADKDDSRCTSGRHRRKGDLLPRRLERSKNRRELITLTNRLGV